MAEDDAEEIARKRLISELEREIPWQWRWEKKYRRYTYLALLSSWAAGFMVTAISVYLLLGGGCMLKWLVGANALLSVFSISVFSISAPLLSNNFRFQQRQEVYDSMARAYTLLKAKLEMGVIPVDEALRQFERIHLPPTEKVIRETP